VSPEAVEQFVDDGFVRIPGAVDPATADACRGELWAATGCAPDDPSTWTRPVIRLEHFASPPFRAAANTPVLHEAFDSLVGSGRWQPRGGLGTVPVRFPSPEAPGDDGWHLEASFPGDDGRYRVNLRSRGRALLLLFLFSEVGPDDAPTRIRVGSHLDVPPLLADAGAQGREWFELCGDAVPAPAPLQGPIASSRAVGGSGVLSPFLVHAAQPHRGREPRFMAQPPLAPVGELDLEAAEPTPVARAVLTGLGR